MITVNNDNATRILHRITELGCFCASRSRQSLIPLHSKINEISGYVELAALTADKIHGDVFLTAKSSATELIEKTTKTTNQFEEKPIMAYLHDLQKSIKEAHHWSESAHNLCVLTSSIAYFHGETNLIKDALKVNAIYFADDERYIGLFSDPEHWKHAVDTYRSIRSDIITEYNVIDF